jgi:hypothetical protein
MNDELGSPDIDQSTMELQQTVGQALATQSPASGVIGTQITSVNGQTGPDLTFSGTGIGFAFSGAGNTITLSITNAATARTALGLDDVSTKKSNLAATAAPTVNDDSGDGYAIGSLWIDTTNDEIYMATDVTVGAAVWKQLS